MSRPLALPLYAELAALALASRRAGDDALADALGLAAQLLKMGDEQVIPRLAALYGAALLVFRHGPPHAYGILLEASRVLYHGVFQLRSGTVRAFTVDELVQVLGRLAAERDHLALELAAVRVELEGERLGRGRAERMAADLAARAPTPRPPSSKSPVPPSVTS